MKKQPQRLSPVMARNPRFNYLPDKDRYLLALDPPKFKFNLIGCGINGLEHINVTHLEGRGTMHGVYDPNPRSIAAGQAAHARFSDTPLVVYDSLEAAANDPEVDGLIICTPNYTHIDVVRQIAGCGKHILLEKPMATTVADAYEIAQVANSHDAVFQIGLQYRYKAMYSEAAYEALERKSAGNIKTINILKHRLPFLDKVNQWNKFSKYSGGTMVEKCCHYFDMINLLAQSRPVQVFASGSQAVNFLEFEYAGEQSDIVDNAFVHILYENGVQAGFHLCMFAPCFQEDLTICGDEGRIRSYIVNNFLPSSGEETRLEVMRGEKRPSRVSNPSYPATVLQSGHNGATYFEHINLINKMEGKESTAATADEGFWSVVVGAAAEESIHTGKIVQINELLARNEISI